MYVGLSKGNPYKKYVCQKYVGEVQGDTYAHARKQRGNFFVHFVAAAAKSYRLSEWCNGDVLVQILEGRGSIMVDTSSFFFPLHSRADRHTK